MRKRKNIRYGLAVIMAVVWAFQSYCNAQMMSLPPFDGDLLKSEDILNLDSIFERKCNDWSQVPELKKVKVYEYIDKNGNKQNFIRTIFGNIEYCIERWVFDDRTGSEETDTDEEEIYCDYENISTFDPKFEYLGYRVGQYCNIDSTLSPATPVKGTDYYQITPAPDSWRIIVRNDTVRKIYLNPPNYSKHSPSLMIDNVMMANRNHVPTMPAYKEYISKLNKDKKKYKRDQSYRSVNGKIYYTLRDRFGFPNPFPFGIMHLPVSDYDESTDIPVRKHNHVGGGGDTLNLDILAANMPKNITDIKEIQNAGTGRLIDFVNLTKAKTIRKPYIVATLKGIEYLLLLDYLPERDAVFVSCIMTYDPAFRLKGLRISGDAFPYFFDRHDDFYDLSAYLIHIPWNCVTKDNKIIYFYKYVWIPLPQKIEDALLTSNIFDEVMLKQYKPQTNSKQ